MSYPVGAIVKLRSGGPRMTVSGGDPNGFDCKWFAGDDQRAARFGEDELEKVGDAKAREEPKAEKPRKQTPKEREKTGNMPSTLPEDQARPLTKGPPTQGSVNIPGAQEPVTK